VLSDSQRAAAFYSLVAPGAFRQPKSRGFLFVIRCDSKKAVADFDTFYRAKIEHQWHFFRFGLLRVYCLEQQRSTQVHQKREPPSLI
jgi:hypothetical protein